MSGNGAEADDNIDKVREILFGDAQQKAESRIDALERKLEALDARLTDALANETGGLRAEIASLREDAQKAASALDEAKVDRAAFAEMLRAMADEIERR